MLLPRPRGPVSASVIDALRGRPATLADPDDPRSEDAQLALWAAYEVGYRGFDDADPDAERNLPVLAWRHRLEDVLEDELRTSTKAMVEEAHAAAPSVEGRLRAMVDAAPASKSARHLQRHATLEEIRAFLVQRSIYHLKESDPHAQVLPRIDGRAKVALAELLYDEYGGGRPERLHSGLFAAALAAAGLDDRYGAYIDVAETATLLSNNVMSLLGTQQRLRGATLGHLAAFEATSTDPCRRIAAGIERVGLPAATAHYYHEHVEADAVHEQVVLGDICAAAVEAEPRLEHDVLWGAAVCLTIDEGVAR